MKIPAQRSCNGRDFLLFSSLMRSTSNHKRIHKGKQFITNIENRDIDSWSSNTTKHYHSSCNTKSSVTQGTVIQEVSSPLLLSTRAWNTHLENASDWSQEDKYFIERVSLCIFGPFNYSVSLSPYSPSRLVYTNWGRPVSLWSPTY